MKNKNNIISFSPGSSKLERQVEAILFAASEPLDIETIEKRVQTNANILNNHPLHHCQNIIYTKSQLIIP